VSLVLEELEKIEKRGLHLWILLILLFSMLTVFVILVIFYSDISELYHQKINSYTFNLLFIGYLGLSLLFIAYIIFQELSLRKLRHSLIEEKISLSIALGNRYQELMGKSVCGWVVKHAQPLLLTPDNMKRYDFDEFIPKQREYVSALCVPLKVGGEVKGVLNVNKLGKEKKFHDEDLKLLSIFAQNAAVAIEKAELYKKNRREVEALKLASDDLM